GLHDDGHLVPDFDGELIDRLIGDRGSNDLPVPDIDPHMGGCCAFLDVYDGALDLVARTDTHDGSRDFEPCGDTACVTALWSNWEGTIVPAGPSRLRRRRWWTLTHLQPAAIVLAGILVLCVRRGQDLAAGRRQLRHGQRLRLRWLNLRLRVDHLVPEPIGEIRGTAGLAFGGFRLALTFGAARRAFDADMEMIVVAVHRPYLGKPAAVAFGFAA